MRFGGRVGITAFSFKSSVIKLKEIALNYRTNIVTIVIRCAFRVCFGFAIEVSVLTDIAKCSVLNVTKTGELAKL